MEKRFNKILELQQEYRDKKLRLSEKRKTKKAKLREFIYQTIKKNLTEQTAQECSQIHALNSFNINFLGCCEMTAQWTNAPGPNDPCKTIQGQAAAINPNYANCCDPNFGTGGEGCDDPLWVNMPMNHPSTIDKLNYCARCAENSTQNPALGNYPVILNSSTPHYSYDPVNGTNYCPCCEPEGCETMLPATHPSCVKCKSNQAAGFPIPPGNGPSAPGSGDNCECCEDEISTGGKCDPTDGTYYGFNPGEDPGDDHNERWGRDCWFCKEDNMPGCTQIVTPMLQGEAFAAYQAGTSGIHGTDSGCNAVEKCGDDGTGSDLKCSCCGPGGLPVMPLPNPNYKSCSSHNGQNGLYGCADVATFDPKSCKKPGGGIPTNPILQAKTIEPNTGDIKKAIREMLRRKK